MRSPYANIMMHKSIAAANDGMYVTYIRRYREANIKRFYGLTVAQFMALPYDIAHMLLRDSEDAAKAASGLLNGLPDLDNELD